MTRNPEHAALIPTHDATFELGGTFTTLVKLPGTMWVNPDAIAAVRTLQGPKPRADKPAVEYAEILFRDGTTRVMPDDITAEIVVEALHAATRPVALYQSPREDHR